MIGQHGAVRLDDAADELVPRHAAVCHVAAGDFEIGAADAGEADLDDTLARSRPRIGIVGAQLQPAVENQGAHGNGLKQKKPRWLV